jgi:hypothetical protein
MANFVPTFALSLQELYTLSPFSMKMLGKVLERDIKSLSNLGKSSGTLLVEVSVFPFDYKACSQ